MNLNLIQKILIFGLFSSAASQLYIKKHVIESFSKFGTDKYRYEIQISGENYFVPHEIYLWDKLADYGFVLFLLSYIGYFYYRKSK